MRRLILLLCLFAHGNVSADEYADRARQAIAGVEQSLARGNAHDVRLGEIERAQAAARDAGLDIWPSTGMASAYVSHDAVGKWIVMKEGFLPVARQKVVDGGKAVVFEDLPGTTCGVLFLPPDDGQPVITPVVLSGPRAPPETPATPTVDPVTPVPPGKRIVFIVEETEQRTPEFRDLLENLRTDSAFMNKHAFFLADEDDMNPAIAKWIRKATSVRPALLIADENGKVLFNGKCPSSRADFDKLLKENGG